MNAALKPLTLAFHLPRWALPRLSMTANRRKRATIDLIHASPHLLRDIGVGDGCLITRGR